MRLARIIGYCILAVSVVYFVGAAWKYAGSLPPIAWDVVTAAAIAGSILLYLVQFVTSGMAWHLWLRAVREPSRPMLAITLFSFSQFAKYVPGSIAHHIARVALGRRHGLGTLGMVVAIALESAWAVIAGVAVAGAALTFVGPSLAGIALPSPLRIALIALIALLLPSAGIWLIGERRPAFMDRWLGERRIAHPDLRALLSGFLLYCANFAISGWILDLLARYLFGAPESHVLAAIGVMAVAWIAAFVALASPGGLGIREAVLLAGLTPAYGAGAALGVAVAYRVVTMLGDGIGFTFGFLAERRLSRRAPT